MSRLVEAPEQHELFDLGGRLQEFGMVRHETRQGSSASGSISYISPVTEELASIEIGETRPDEVEAAVDVVTRAMSTSPLHLAAWGEPAGAHRAAAGLFTSLYRHFPGQRPLVARMDPGRPHSHFGPFGVDPSLQGRGVGSLVLAEYTRRLDERREDAYLETDKPENVRLYKRFGFEVTGEADVIGVPNWFMWRDKRAV